MQTPDIPELTPSTEELPPMKTQFELAQDELQSMCDRVQALRHKIWIAKDDIQKAMYKGQLIEVVKQLTVRHMDLIADGINVCVKYAENGCPIRVSKACKQEFYE